MPSPLPLHDLPAVRNCNCNCFGNQPHLPSPHLAGTATSERLHLLPAPWLPDLLLAPPPCAAAAPLASLTWRPAQTPCATGPLSGRLQCEGFGPEAQEWQHVGGELTQAIRCASDCQAQASAARRRTCDCTIRLTSSNERQACRLQREEHAGASINLCTHLHAEHCPATPQSRVHLLHRHAPASSCRPLASNTSP